MDELVGKRCLCEFAMDPVRWPFPGFPANVIVEAVDMPMVKLRSFFSDRTLWINASAILKLEAFDQ